MPTRSVKLKLIVPRQQDIAMARDIWTTHRAMNAAVSKIEEIFLLCRGAGYETSDGARHSAEAVHARALTMARDVQEKNGKQASCNDEEILGLFRELYEDLVPSCRLDEKGKPLSGNAQQSRGLVGPLMNPDSKGFESTFDEIIDPLPDWCEWYREDSEESEAVSTRWLQSEQGQHLLHKKYIGRLPGWVSSAREGKPWQMKFLRHQEKKRNEARGIAGTVRNMRAVGLLPLLSPLIGSQLVENRTMTSDWDYLAVRLAVGHLLSWESWNHRTRTEHAKVSAAVEKQRKLVESYGDIVDVARDYEKQRHEELKTVSEATDDRPYRITRRQLRGWSRIWDRWHSPKVTGEEDRVQVLAELQTELRGGFGDPHLFRWMAQDGHEALRQDKEILPEIARLNAVERLLARKKQMAVCTLAESRVHPRWVQYGKLGDSNLRQYSLRMSEDRRSLELRLPCLRQTAEGLEEVKHTCRLAPTSQLEAPAFGGERKNPTVVFGPLNDRHTARLGAADLFLSRRRIENQSEARLAEGDIGPVWLKLSLDMDHQAPEGWIDGRGHAARPKEVFFFQKARDGKPKMKEAPSPGLRVLSVDLGIRSFAACSVFELVDDPPKEGLSFCLDEPEGLWARHERSFLLTLPGENPTGKHREARQEVDGERRLLARGVTFLGTLLRSSLETDPRLRRSSLESWQAMLEDVHSGNNGESLIEHQELERLLEYVGEDGEKWASRIGKMHRECERRLGGWIGEWRRRTRPRSYRRYQGGKSMWAIQYQSDIRNLLRRWSNHARRQGQIRRANREKGGIFASRLLSHINAMKNDRIKTGADMIVQAARGFRPSERKGWIKTYEPCRVILFEDLARYRFRIDRPRFENSQLMRWSHRQIVEETSMQAEVYGISVDTTSPGFTSRYHARTGAPGIRVRRLSREDLSQPRLQERLERELEGTGVTIEHLREGQLVPWPGGETFATLRSRETDGEVAAPCLIHADLNAAQNLHRRFWTRHLDAYRVRAISNGDVGYTITSARQGRVAGSLQSLTGRRGRYVLEPGDDSDGYVLHVHSQRRSAMREGGGVEDEGYSEADQEIMDALDADTEDGMKGEAFFRDPSGLVLRPDRWYPQKEYWGRVRRQIGQALLKAAASDPF